MTYEDNQIILYSSFNKEVRLTFRCMGVPFFCGGMMLFGFTLFNRNATAQDTRDIQQQFIQFLKNEGVSSYYAYDVEGCGWDNFFKDLPDSFDTVCTNGDYEYNATWTKFRSEPFTNMNSNNVVVQVGYKVGILEGEYVGDGSDGIPY